MADRSAAMWTVGWWAAAGKGCVGEHVGGNMVGEVVGLRVGNTVGEVVGLVVGDTVGELVGLAVGLAVGEVVGETVGEVVSRVACEIDGDTVPAQAVGEVDGVTRTVLARADGKPLKRKSKRARRKDGKRKKRRKK